MIILFACLVGWLDSSSVEFQKKINAQSLKTWVGIHKTSYENS